MNRYKIFAEITDELFKINTGINFGNDIFQMLKKVISFDSGYIFFQNPERLEHSFNPQTSCLNDIKPPYLKENLEFKNSVYAEIVIAGNGFDEADKKIFKAFSSIIANIIKDIEIAKVIKMQSEILQAGYIETSKQSTKLKRADKAKTKFLSHVTHELRTPLNSILGYSELLSAEIAGKLNKKQKDYVEDIKIAGINLLGMINEVLDISKIESGNLTLNITNFSIENSVNEVVNTIYPLALKKKIKISKKICDIRINADCQKIQQILFNLIGNSVKYTPENGNIRINVSVKDRKLIIAVKDNGIGIDKKYHKKIFQRFKQITESDSNSTGLGLAITKELVKLHGGKIFLNSETGIGSEFVVELPLN